MPKIGAATVLLASLAGGGAAWVAGDNNKPDTSTTLDKSTFTETACGTYSGRGCAPAKKRVDLRRPSFSSPTKITNPLFPVSRLRSVVLLGQVDGKPFRTETTLLPGTKTVIWNGRQVRVLVSQYMAYLDGRLDEVAIDRYAQADANDVAGVAGDVGVLEWIRDRIPQTLDRAGREEIDARLRALRAATDAKNLPAAADHAARLGARVRDLAGRQGTLTSKEED